MMMLEKCMFYAVLFFGLAFGSVSAQTSTSTAPAQSQQQQSASRHGAAWIGHTVTGTVAQTTADHYTITTQKNESYTVQFTASTRFFKQGSDTGNSSLSSGDIKAGDTISCVGDIDGAAKTVSARVVIQADPTRTQQMQQMRANYGKTWMAGGVTAINGSTVTLAGSVDGASLSFVINQNTSIKSRDTSLTLTDLQVGDATRVEGTLSGGVFTATLVEVMGVRRIPPPPAQ